MKNLTNSALDRQNLLNNNPLLKYAYEQLGFNGVLFDGKYRFTKSQVVRYYEVDVRTIERLLARHAKELQSNGYELLIGNKLDRFKYILLPPTDIHVGHIPQLIDNEMIRTRTSSIGIFTFRAFLNIGMLLNGSEKALEIRKWLLDLAIDFLNKKLGGSTKYINQRDEEFFPAAIREHKYRKEFIDAINANIDSNSQLKYAQLTDKIYISIFKEQAKEYRFLLKLSDQESVRDTLYSEILDLVASYENGFADFLHKESQRLKRKLKLLEATNLFNQFESITTKIYEPLREKARTLMASRDMVFRELFHENLLDYVQTVSPKDYDKFLGEKSLALEERLLENMEVFKRLKER